MSHFIHRFREIRGVSPREFRRQVAAHSPEAPAAEPARGAGTKR